MDTKKLFDQEEGDRFYFLTDRARKVWIFMDVEHFDQGDEGWRVHTNATEAHLKDDSGNTRTVRRNYQVVFLRNGKSS